MGETGERDDVIYWATTDYFEANNIGWSFWPWKKMETKNTPYSIKTPKNWRAITTYSRKADGEKPSPEVAQAAFDELLQNIRLTNCVFYPAVVNSLFHRAPVRVEAENYGHEGMDHSYLVNDTKQKAKYYRTSEPVPVEPVDDSGQAIRLGTGEWTAYVVNSLEAKSYELKVRAKAKSASAIFQISVNGNSQEVVADGQDWVEFKLKPVNLTTGTIK